MLLGLVGGVLIGVPVELAGSLRIESMRAGLSLHIGVQVLGIDPAHIFRAINVLPVIRALLEIGYGIVFTIVIIPLWLRLS